jgi:hypothetical protein
MKHPILLAAAVGVSSLVAAGVTVAQAGPNATDPGPLPAVLSRARTPSDALPPEMASLGARKGGPIVAETRLVHEAGGRSIWLAPNNTGGVCVLVLMRAGGESAGGGNCVELSRLSSGSVLRLRTVAGSVDLAVTADGTADKVASRLGGQVATPNVVFVPTAPIGQ